MLLLLLACSGPPKDDSAAVTDDTGSADVSICGDPVDPPCIDDMILDLSLQDDKVSDGEVTNEQDGDDWVTTIDATAGGMNSASDNPWVYVRFTADGAERIDLDDETALEDTTWHMALHRFIVRLNSGDSGPSCVGGAEMQRADYANIDAVPAGTTFAVEDFYDDECTVVEDGSGLPGSIAVVLAAWWDYPGGCVETTDIPFLVQLDDGSVIKLVIEAYYAGEGQDECNEEGSTREESAIYTIRWSYLGE